MAAPARPSTAILPAHAYLRTGQCLVANDGSHFALMGSDGRFAVCSGSGPDDPAARTIAMVPADARLAGEYFVIMQADGNLCVYQGTGPSDNHGFVWGLNTVRRDMPRPPGDGYVAVLGDDGTFGVYDRNAGHDPREGPYWTIVQARQPEEEFIVTNVLAVRALEPTAPDHRPYIRHRIQPRYTCQLTRLTLAVGSGRARPTPTRINVYRGEIDSYDLMISETFDAQFISWDDLRAKQRQPYDFLSPPLLVGGEIYTIEVSIANRSQLLSVGLTTANPGPGPIYDDMVCFTGWTLRA